MLSHKIFPRCDETPEWVYLTAAYLQKESSFNIGEAFAKDANRFTLFSQNAPYLFADLSKNYINEATQNLLFNLARACKVEAQRDAMFAGELVNNTESRAAMHFLLREDAAHFTHNDGDKSPCSASEKLKQAWPEVARTRAAMLAYAERIRADNNITDIVNIGIGGSDLGPQMAVLALDTYAHKDKRLHFISNVDGHEIAAVLAKIQPENTLFIIASKTFTTAETMRNAETAKAWFLRTGGADRACQMEHHFVALTSNTEAACSFGINTVFGFQDWVGGRYSLWSAIGLPIAIAIGEQGFMELLAGAHAMDRHFCTQPLSHNLPIRLALLDIWYRNFHQFSSRCIAPYHQGLRRFPAYLQQLEMESNGKRVDRQGVTLAYATSPVVWGEPGTNGQHAFFQMLHQGSDIIPLEILVVKQASHDLAEHQNSLNANALAQAKALMDGKIDPSGHRHFPGNRPSTFLILDRLNPATLGALIALYEHRVFVCGALWGINSFDQWGVELGKVLAKDLAHRLLTGSAEGLDSSTAGLLAQLKTS